jgi:hypothetical protein
MIVSFSGVPMKKAAEYRRHAKDCRELAAKAGKQDQREQLLRMAETWESLALDREMFLERDPKYMREPKQDR